MTTARRADLVVHLTDADVSLVVDARGGRLPSIVHWGASIGALADRDVIAVCDATVPVIGSNNPDVPLRLAILPEHHAGWVGRPGLAGSFLDLASGWSPRFEVTAAEVDGVGTAGPVHRGGPAEVVFHAIDDTGRLDLRLVVALLPGGLVRTRAHLENDASVSYRLDDLSLCLPVPAAATEILDFTGQHNLERVPQRSPLRDGVHLRENRRGRTGADSASLLHLGEPGFGFERGRVWAVHTAWSGNHRHYAERVHTGEQVIGGGEVLLPGEITLAPNEAYTSPWIYASYGDGLDEVAHRIHRMLRGRDDAPGPDRPVTLNVWEAVYFRHDADELIGLADKAAALGVERFVLDDGWFGARRHDRAGLGDWVVSTDVWPAGLHPLVDRVTQSGMQFGLWFEPEMVNIDSGVAREHPEWIMAARGDLPIESRFQQVLNLAVPDAYAHVKGQISALLDEYEISYIKWDHNRDLIEAGDRTHGGRPAVHAQTGAFYRLLREIRDEHPGLEIESCSSGGGRVDLGVAELTDRVWVSDNTDPHSRQTISRWTAQLLPPEYLGAHVAAPVSHTTGRTTSLSFRAGTALFGHFGIEWNLNEAGEEDLVALAQWIALYKEERGMLLAGDMVRIDTDQPAVVAHGVVSHDRARAMFSVAVLDSVHPDPPARLRLRGLDADARYRVEPLVVGEVPPGLIPPAWWGAASDAAEFVRPEDGAQDRRSGVTFPGSSFPAAALHGVGVASPRQHPDTLVIYRLQRVD